MPASGANTPSRKTLFPHWVDREQMRAKGTFAITEIKAGNLAIKTNGCARYHWLTLCHASTIDGLAVAKLSVQSSTTSAAAIFLRLSEFHSAVRQPRER
jgi:hypothetical protein